MEGGLIFFMSMIIGGMFFYNLMGFNERKTVNSAKNTNPKTNISGQLKKEERYHWLINDTIEVHDKLEKLEKAYVNGRLKEFYTKIKDYKTLTKKELKDLYNVWTKKRQDLATSGRASKEWVYVAFYESFFASMVFDMFDELYHFFKKNNLIPESEIEKPKLQKKVSARDSKDAINPSHQSDLADSVIDADQRVIKGKAKDIVGSAIDIETIFSKIKNSVVEDTISLHKEIIAFLVSYLAVISYDKKELIEEYKTDLFDEIKRDLLLVSNVTETLFQSTTPPAIISNTTQDLLDTYEKRKKTYKSIIEYEIIGIEGAKNNFGGPHMAFADLYKNGYHLKGTPPITEILLYTPDLIRSIEQIKEIKKI